MHPIVADHPAWTALQERKARTAAARVRTMDAAGSWEARYRAAKADHAAAVQAATAGDADPPAPFVFDEPKPDAGEILYRLTAETAAIRDAEREFLRRHGRELHAALADREAALLDDVRTAVEKLAHRHADTVAELDQLTASAAALARANGQRADVRDRADLADVVTAVLDGSRLVRDLPGVSDPAPQPNGHGDGTPRRSLPEPSTAAGALRGRR